MPDHAQPDDQSELNDAWKALEENLPLHPRLGEIPDICKRANNIIEEITGLLDVNDKAAFEWFETLTYDLESARKNSVSLLDNYSVLAARAEISLPIDAVWLSLRSAATCLSHWL